MIKGLAITPPVIGRISIGKLVNRNDKWLPEKDDSFTLPESDTPSDHPTQPQTFTRTSRLSNKLGTHRESSVAA
jgi:hypothetical protein